MIYGSVCSGIEAASVAWHPLGWRAAFFSEIEAFPRAVLKKRYPKTPLHGDFTTIEAGQYDAVDVLVGGTPCQSFSVAGLRGGLGDDRGNLALEFLKLADRLRPRWVVWENVPGVLSSTSHAAPDPVPPAPPVGMGCDGAELETQDEYDSEELHAFYCFLAGLSELGYGFAYRVLDAQFFGVPQRRRRVFVVGYFGDWRRAAAVLFEPEGLRGDSAPRREAGKGVAPTISARPSGGGGLGTDFDLDGGLIQAAIQMGQQDISWSLTAGMAASGSRMPSEQGALITAAFGGNNQSGPIDVATAVNACHTASGRQDFETETFIAHALRGEGFDASEDGTGRGTAPMACPAQAIAFDCKASGQNGFGVGEIAGTMRAMGHAGSHQNAGGHQAALVGAAVRRLTPRECERLQGFPDDYTAITRRRKPAADGPRYKALGNSMAVPVMRWIGERIQMVDKL